MPIRRRRDWELKESETTPEGVFRERRALLKTMGLGGLIAAGAGPLLAACGDEAPIVPEADPTAALYPVKRNTAFALDRDITAEADATSYNNFYEFGSTKNVRRAAQALRLRPWEVRVDGLVEKPFTVAIDDLLKKMPLEERLYRFRCVEAWSMAVPWSGFPFRALVDLARPLSGAKYVAMETFNDPAMAPGQKSGWYPWPYVEGLTMAEATHELAFLATGIYGKPLPKQNGAPLRLAVPWKYGFWANVNPAVAHPRWSQATERVLGKGTRVPTLLYNGYAGQVAGLYKGMEGERLFA